MTDYVCDKIIEQRSRPQERDGAFIRFLKSAFSTVPNGIITLVLLSGAVYLLIWFIDWGILSAQWFGETCAACADPDSACWAYIIARWKPILAGQYPREELWRVLIFFCMLISLVIWIVVERIPKKIFAIIGSWTVFPVLSYIILVGGVFGLKNVPTNDWGGLLITVVTAVFTMISSLPFGLLLAIGRMSKMPVIKTLCVAFIEIVRGIPLLAFLFAAATILPVFLPEGISIDLFTRTLIAFMLFNGSMTSEVFRGGLQSIKQGQYDAAATVGLGWLTTMVFIVIPQAIRIIIPALVNTMIIIIKETSVLMIIGLLDFVAVIHLGTESPDWIGGHNILVSGYVFTAICYMVTCLSLSKYSRRFESRF